MHLIKENLSLCIYCQACVPLVYILEVFVILLIVMS